MIKKLNILLIGIIISLNTLIVSANRIDSIDVIHYNIETNLRNISSKQISGIVTLVTTAKFSQTKSLVLDLLKFTVSSVQCNGNTSSFTQTDSTLHVRLGQTYTIGDTIRISVVYAGSPTLDARWGGFYFSGNYAYNMGVGMASNPPNFGRCWFPCIDNFIDKATYEFNITTDSGYMAVCNGLQSPATPAVDNGIIWHWRLSQEIPTYIANVAVSKYVLIQNNFKGLNRNIPVIIAVNAADTAKARASFAKLNNALQCFEEKFGAYEFDRVGYVGVPFNSGAMEHAGNISYPLYAIDGSSTYETLFAHELSHHWFGNLVTTNTAVDMWLNEGWASYCEALFLECVYGKEAYDKEINNELFEVLRWAHVRDGAYLPVSGVPLAQTYGTHVYTKGSLMAHSLRVLVNNDTAFFNTLKSYFEKYKFKVASSIDFQNHFEKRFGSEIIDFFNSYIFDKGHTDLQLIRLDNNIKEKNCEAVFKLMSRHKTVLPDVVWAYVSYNLGVQWNEFLLPIYKNKLTGDYILQISIGALLVSNLKIGTNQGTMNGATTHREWVKGTTPKTLSNALLIITPQINPDSAFVFIQHHFAQPSVNQNQLPIGIRISSERYWNIDGLWNSQFRATAFFNYDGSTPSSKNGGFLDNELIKGTEDSLVLLYRPNAETAFVVETDLTFQPGSNKADKTGRFWVNNLKKGDYVFGYKDISAAINNIQDNQRTLKLYPNPTEGNFTVEFPPRHQDGTIKVIDMKGALILESKFVKSDLEIKLNTSSWNKGNYILIFEDDRGKLTENFIVK